MIDTFIPISLASITYNEEKNLGPRLEIAKGLVSEIVTVDSGSTDRTTQSAADYRAQVYQNPWPGHVAQKTLWMRFFKTMVLKHAWRDGWRG